MSDPFRSSPSTRSTPIPGVPGPYLTPISPSQTLPLMDGVAAIGTMLAFYAVADHVHPSDTSKASLTGANFTGLLQGPTPSPGDNSNRVATTAFVVGSLATYAPLNSPTFTGTVTIPAGAAIAGYAPLASPNFTGTVVIPSGAVIADYAPLASPVFTGKPIIPGVTDGSNAPTGTVGEYLSSIVQGVPLTNNVITNATTLTLPAGDWDVWADGNTGGAILSNISFSVSPTSLVSGPAAADNSSLFEIGVTGGSTLLQNVAPAVPPCRFSLNAPATAFLVVLALFASGTVTINVKLCARRVR